MVGRDRQRDDQRTVEQRADVHGAGHAATGRRDAAGAGGQHRDHDADVHLDRRGWRDAVPAVAR